MNNSLSNQIYRDLCAKLGELVLQENTIKQQIFTIEAQIALLNAIAPKIAELEKKSEITLDVTR